MIEKKDPRVNLEKYRATIFGIGLLAAGSFTLAAFTYTSPMEVEEAKISAIQTTVDYQVQQVDAPKDEPKTIEDTEVEDEQITTEALEDISEEMKAKENSNEKTKSEVSSGTQKRLKGPEGIRIKPKEVEAAAILYPDKDAEFVGGFPAMSKFIVSTQVYPDIDIHEGNQGTAYVQFIVERDGSVTNVKASGKVSRSLKKEAERVVRKSPNWIPGEVGGKRVRSIVRLPITFVLE